MRRPHPAPLALGAMMLMAAALLLYAGRHLTFFYDEWNFILERRGSSVATYLDPHNGHLSLVPVAIYKALFATVGLRHYLPYRVILVLLHIVSAGLLYLLVSTRLGRWLGLVPVVLLLFMGSAYQDLLWPFQIGYLGSVAAGLGALCLLDRPGGAARDAWVAILLAVSLASSGVGIPFLLAAAVLLIPSRSRPTGAWSLTWRRLWVVAGPAVLFAIWYVGWGTSERISASAVGSVPEYVAKALAGAVGGIAGVNTHHYRVALAIIALAALGLALYRRRPRSLTPMLLSTTVGALAFWVLAAIARADLAEPMSSRYVYIGAVFILLIAAEAAAGLRPGLPILGIGCLLVAAAVALNVRDLRGGERGFRQNDESVRAALTAVQIAAPVVAPQFMPDHADAPQITAGPYLSAVRELGSPAYTLAEVRTGSERRRAQVDAVLVGAEGIRLRPPRSCRRAGSAPTGLALPAGSRLVLQSEGAAGLAVGLRRFGEQFVSLPDRRPGRRSAAELTLPVDLAPRELWRIRISRPARYRPCA